MQIDCDDNNLRVADIFCGGGGSSCGIRQVKGLQIVLAIDNDKHALKTYKDNNPPHDTLCMDVNNVTDIVHEIKKRNVDIICGSPPCQDFSMAGNRVEGERARLSSKFGDIVVQCKPKICIMENVPEMTQSVAFEEFKNNLIRHGYHIAVLKLNAANLETPQSRKRVFVVATLGMLSELKSIINEASRLHDRPMSCPHDKIPHFPDTYRLPPRNLYDAGVMSSKRPSRTLRCNCASLVNASSYKWRVRDAGPIQGAATLPMWQLGMLSGFPKTYIWPESRCRAGRIIGNAVCPPVMKWVATMCLTRLRSEREEEEAGVYLEEVAHKNILFQAPNSEDIKVLQHESNANKEEVLQLGGYILTRLLDREDELLVRYVDCTPSTLEFTCNTFVLIEGSDKVYVNCARDKRNRRALQLLQLSYLNGGYASTEDIQNAAKIYRVKVVRTSPTIILHYVQGTHTETDAIVRNITAGYIRPGWTLEIRERSVTTNITDDLYWFVPMEGKMHRYRSTTELERAELL